MGISFAHPGWLWALLLAAPMCAVALAGFTSMSRWRRASAAFARALLTALIVAMLAGAQSVRETQRLAVVGVVDVSGSVQRFGAFGGPGSARTDESVEARARRYFADQLANRGPDDLFGLVVFDGRTATVATPSRAGVLDRSMAMLPIEGSDIAGALRHAAALIPADAAGRLVLISDGVATGADPAEAAALIGGASVDSGEESDSGRAVRVPIDVVPVDYRVGDEVIVERLDAPPSAPAGSTVPLRVQIRATAPTRGTLRLLREGEPLDISRTSNDDDSARAGGGRRVAYEPGRHVEVLEITLEDRRVSRFEVVYEPDTDASGALIGDRAIDNNRAEAFTISPGESRVLLVDGVSNGAPGSAGTLLARTLRDAGVAVEAVAPGGMPRDLLGLQAHDLVILQNVGAEELTADAVASLTAFVRDLGGGLLVVGGPDTLGPGGWRGSALEPLLPVRLDIPEKLVTPEAAIVLVLDNSGSMRRGVLGSSRSQQEVANESAARAIGSLDPGDLIGVIAFSGSAQIVHPLGPARETAPIIEATRAIASGGGTNLPPALELARAQLADAEAKHKHIVVLSDGQSENSDRLAGLARSIREDGIRISSIAVGDGADLETLESIADEGEGAFYHVLNPGVLPNVFLKAVRIVRSPLVRESPFRPLTLETGSPLTEGLVASAGEPPLLGGLVLTQARPEPTITYAMATPEGEPVLAHWAVELGQVAVFTSDAHDWARRWVDWQGYRVFWTRVARLLARTTGGETGSLAVRNADGELSIVYDATDQGGEPIDLLAVDATVFGPTGDPEIVTLRQTGPGKYTGSVRPRRGGAHIVIARPSLGGTPLPPLLAGATVARNAEYARLATDARALESIAGASGGRVLGWDEAAGLFDRSALEPRRTRTPLWPVLLGWTVVVFLLDVGTRRIAWDRLLPERSGEREMARIAAGAGQRVAALRGARTKEDGADRAPMPTAAALSDEDADRLRREARAARYRSQAEAYKKKVAGASTQTGDAAQAQKTDKVEKPAPASKPASNPAPNPAKKPAPDPEEEVSGLLAAKRRARKRFEEGGDG